MKKTANHTLSFCEVQAPSICENKDSLEKNSAWEKKVKQIFKKSPVVFCFGLDLHEFTKEVRAIIYGTDDDCLLLYVLLYISLSATDKARTCLGYIWKAI